MFLKRLLMMKSNKTTISILKSVLPNDMQMAYDYLYDYFNGFDIEIKENQSSYNLCLSKSDFNYCEDLSEGLHQLGIEANEISDYCYITNNSCICLSETIFSNRSKSCFSSFTRIRKPFSPSLIHARAPPTGQSVATVGIPIANASIKELEIPSVMEVDT